MTIRKMEFVSSFVLLPIGRGCWAAKCNRPQNVTGYILRQFYPPQNVTSDANCNHWGLPAAKCNQYAKCNHLIFFVIIFLLFQFNFISFAVCFNYVKRIISQFLLVTFCSVLPTAKCNQCHKLQPLQFFSIQNFKLVFFI